jgi:hypothetical protein
MLFSLFIGILVIIHSDYGYNVTYCYFGYYNSHSKIAKKVKVVDISVAKTLKT